MNRVDKYEFHFEHSLNTIVSIKWSFAIYILLFTLHVWKNAPTCVVCTFWRFESIFTSIFVVLCVCFLFVISLNKNSLIYFVIELQSIHGVSTRCVNWLASNCFQWSLILLYTPCTENLFLTQLRFLVDVFLSFFWFVCVFLFTYHSHIMRSVWNQKINID